MIALIATVFVASLLGSLHCAGMCGPFVAFAVGSPGDNHRWRRQVAYHGGRLVTYTTVGAVAGSLGALVDLGGALVGLQSTAAVLAGSIMIVVGLAIVLRAWGVPVKSMPGSGVLRGALSAGQRAAMKLRPVPRAASIGLLTTLLPCGWLYAFAVTAAGTAHPVWGALTMAAFWLGTVPMLAAIGVGVQRLAGSLAPKLPVVTAFALVVIGLATVFTRLSIDTAAFAALDTPAARAGEHDASAMPCCEPEPDMP